MEGKLKKNKQTFSGYGTASGIVAKALGAVGNLSAVRLAELICAKKRWREVKSIGKSNAKKMVMDYAAELTGTRQEIGEFKAPKRLEIAAAAVTVKRHPPAARPLEPQEFYWSDEWRRVRYIALKASRGCCELCGEGPSPGKPLHVDHIKPRSLYPNLELDIKNLQVLCADCNLGKGNRDQVDWRKKDGDKWTDGPFWNLA